MARGMTARPNARQCQLQTFQSRRCAMPLMPAFRRRKTSAAIVGRLLAGYGELEFLLAFCVGAAHAAAIAPSARPHARAHRWHHNEHAIKDMFRQRAESKRFNRAKKRMNKEFAGAGLKSDYIETMGAMNPCLKNTAPSPLAQP